MLLAYNKFIAKFLRFLHLSCIVILLIFVLLYNIAFTGELKSYSEQKEMAIKMIDTFNANYGKLRTLSGDMRIVVKKYDVENRNKLLSHYESLCTYAIDLTKEEVLLINSPEISVSFTKDNKKQDSPLLKQAMRWYEGCFYYSITTSFMPDSTHPDAKKKFARQLQIRAIPDPDLLLYYPLLKWTPSGSITEVPDYFKTIYSENDEEKILSLKEKRQILREEAEQIWNDWKKNGVPGVTFGLDGTLLKQSSGNEYNSRNLIVDISKGAMIVSYDNTWKTKNPSQKWTCDLQRVSGVWIPEKIYNEIYRPEKEIEVTELFFDNQKVNPTLTSKDFAKTKLGVRQGDQGFDHRIDTSFIVEGDEYPLPEGMDHLLVISNFSESFV
jgi:hypothetical protein